MNNREQNENARDAKVPQRLIYFRGKITTLTSRSLNNDIFVNRWCVWRSISTGLGKQRKFTLPCGAWVDQRWACYNNTFVTEGATLCADACQELKIDPKITVIIVGRRHHNQYAFVDVCLPALMYSKGCSMTLLFLRTTVTIVLLGASSIAVLFTPQTLISYCRAMLVFSEPVGRLTIMYVAFYVMRLQA